MQESDNYPSVLSHAVRVGIEVSRMKGFIGAFKGRGVPDPL
jgi:hypothetical protein